MLPTFKKNVHENFFRIALLQNIEINYINRIYNFNVKKKIQETVFFDSM